MIIIENSRSESSFFHLQVALQSYPTMSAYCKILRFPFFAYQSHPITDNLNKLNVCIMYSLGLGLTYGNSKMFFIRTIQGFHEKRPWTGCRKWMKTTAAYKKNQVFTLLDIKWKCLNIDRRNQLFGLMLKKILLCLENGLCCLCRS